MRTIAKAIAAAAASATTALTAALPDGVTAGEWALVALAALGAGALTWAVPNADDRQVR